MAQLVCPHCQAVNRTPDTRDASAAKCGRCHEKLFQGQPTDVTGPEFELHARATRGAAVLVDVWAPWCAPCRAMAPQFAAAAAQLEPSVRLVKLNADAEQAAARALGVSGVPALILFRDGRVIDRKAGAMSADQLVAWTRRALAEASAQSLERNP